MSLVRFLIALLIGTVLSWLAWALVLTTIDPRSGGIIAVLLFFGSFCLAMIGTLTLIGFFFRYWFERERIPFRQIAVAFRQATFLGGGVTVGLMLQAARWLSWWAGGLLLLLIILLEVFFLTEQARRPNNS